MSESQEIPSRPLRQNADANGQKAETEFRAGLLSLMPLVGSVSRSMCRNADLAEDIQQEALCKAWAARSRFRPGSNLKAWLLTILRNTYYQHRRRSWRRVALDEDSALNIIGPEDEQVWNVHLADTIEVLRGLSFVQRESLVLVGVGGFKYDEVAAICDCAAGTAKSRVTRARKKIRTALEESGKPNRVRQTPIGGAAHEILQELDTHMGRTGLARSIPNMRAPNHIVPSAFQDAAQTAGELRPGSTVRDFSATIHAVSEAEQPPAPTATAPPADDVGPTCSSPGKEASANRASRSSNEMGALQERTS